MHGLLTAVRGPRIAPWVDGLASAGLYALLAWLAFGEILSHWLEIVAIGVGMFFLSRRHHRRLSAQPNDPTA